MAPGNHRVLPVLLTLLLVVFSTALASDDQDQIKIEALDSIVNAYAIHYGFSGNVFVGKGDSILYTSSQGMANYEHSIPNTLETTFRLASISKQFTAAALLVLEQRGKVGFQAPLSQYVKNLKPEIGDKITLHHVLSHSGGLARDIESLTDKELGQSYISLDELIKIINTSTLVFEPGAKWSYSNLGYALAAAVIESVTGKTYGAAMDELLFAPLGMKNTGHEKNSSLLMNRASGYVSLPDGTINAAHEDKSYVIGAGSIYSTAKDLFIWGRELLNGDLLSAENKKRLFSKQAGRYSYGWFIDTYVWPPVGEDDKAVNPHHEGGCPGFESKISLLTKHDIVVILLCNRIPANLNGLGNQVVNTLVGFEEGPPRPDGRKVLYETLFGNGVDGAIALAGQWRAEGNKYLVPKPFDMLLVGRGYLESQEYAKAHLIFDLLIKARPKWSYPFLFKGIAFEQQGRPEDAATYYRKVLDVDPNDSNAINRLKMLTVK